MTNSEVIQKADLALSDLETAGKLNPEQTDRFIRTLIDQPTLLNAVRTVAMGAPQMKINKIGFGTRILHPAVSAIPLPPELRAKPDLGQVQFGTPRSDRGSQPALRCHRRQHREGQRQRAAADRRGWVAPDHRGPDCRTGRA